MMTPAENVGAGVGSI